MSNYYVNELNGVKVNATQYPAKIKVFANENGQDTRFIDLNEDSGKALINWLDKNYINQQDKNDLTARIVDKLVINGLLKDCTDTDNPHEWEANDIILECIENYFK